MVRRAHDEPGPSHHEQQFLPSKLLDDDRQVLMIPLEPREKRRRSVRGSQGSEHLSLSERHVGQDDDRWYSTIITLPDRQTVIVTMVSSAITSGIPMAVIALQVTQAMSMSTSIIK